MHLQFEASATPFAGKAQRKQQAQNAEINQEVRYQIRAITEAEGVILRDFGSPQFSGVLTKAASRTCGLKVANPH